MSDAVKTLSGQDERRGDGADLGFRDTVRDVQDRSRTSAASFKDQASEAAQEAKSTVVALAGEARDRLAEMVDQQKAAGADQVAGVARAAEAAAGNLKANSPQLAKLVQSAADTVDNVAQRIRGSDVSEVIASLSSFGRRRPLAFFGGAVVLGFALARFLKSDAPGAGPVERPLGPLPL